MESTRKHLIELLEKNQQKYVSGQQLSEQLHISRTAVWKHMKELEKDGYKIDAVTRKGYQIKEFPQKLSQNTLQWGLHTKWIGKRLIHKQQVASTQIDAHRAAIEGAEHGTVIIADEQVAGKGRMDRSWHSPKQQGIWMSIILRPKILPYQAPQITLLAATVLAEIMKEKMNIIPGIKWPNDLLIDGKKVAGILTEMQAEHDQIQYIVLGIGMNVNQSISTFPEDIKQTATSIKNETNQEWSLKEIIQQILSTFETTYEQFLDKGFSGIKEKWETYGYKIGEVVTIHTLQKQWQAKLLGIEPDGALLVENEKGSTQKLYSAEIKW